MERELAAIRGMLLARGYVIVSTNDACYSWRVFMSTYVKTVPVGRFWRVKGRWIASNSWLQYAIQGALMSIAVLKLPKRDK